MTLEAPDRLSFLRPTWSRIPARPWLLSVLLLALLAAGRYLAVFGPPQARILFPVHCLLMWALPFIFLTPHGRREMGLCKHGNTTSALALSSFAGAICGLGVYAIGMALYGNSPDNWCVSIRSAFQLDQLSARMPPAVLFAVIALPAMILTPIGEEILFRGFIQQTFALRWNALVGTAVNSLTFGLIHLHVHGLWHDAAGFHLRIVSAALMVLLLAGVSVMFTILRLRTGSLFTAMVAHAVCNLAMIAAIFFRFLG